MAGTRTNKEVPEKVTASHSQAPSRHIPPAECDGLKDRIIEVLGDLKVSWFAKECGFGESLLRKYLKGAQPNASNLVAIANVARVTVDWLATGRLPKFRSSLQVLPDEAHKVMIDGGSPVMVEEIRAAYGASLVGYTAVPLYEEVIASAGNGAINGREHTDDALMFKEDWLRSELGARPQDLWLIRVHGDSMEPTLRAGDIILVDSRASRPDREGIYIVRLGEALLVKRLQVMPGRKIRVTSDNSAFEPWIISQEDQNSDIAIVGRVVWSGRRM